MAYTMIILIESVDVKDFIPVMGYELKCFKEKKKKQTTIGYSLLIVVLMINCSVLQ